MGLGRLELPTSRLSGMSRALVDAGGWKDSKTILKCYQQPDEDLIRGELDARGQPNMAANRQDNRQEGPIYRKQEPRPVT